MRFKIDVITRTCFFGHYTAKNKDIALKFYLHFVCMYLDDIHSVFWMTWNLWFFRQLVFEKEHFEFWGSKSKNITILRLPFCRAFNFTPLGVFWLRLTAKLNILAALKHLLFFDPTWRNMTSQKRHFLKKNRQIFLKFWWPTSNWCWGRYWKFRVDICRRFLSYRENPAGRGRYSPPPQHGAG